MVRSITILSFLWITIIRAEVCSRSECVHASAQLLSRIDTSVDPCDNFYDFACGSFIEENYTPDESVAVDTFTKLKDAIDAQVYALLDGAKDDEANAMLKLSQDLFKTCLARNREAGKEDVKALKEIVDDLGGWPLLEGAAWDGSKWTLDGTIAKIRKLLGLRTDKIFDIASFIINLENANNPSIRPSATFFSLRNAYSNYINNLATFLGATGEASAREDELNHLLDFEYKLNTINLKYQQLSRSGDIPVKSDDLLRQIFHIQWLDYFHPSQMKNIQITEDGKVSSFEDEMRSLLNSTSARTFANYAILRVVDFVVAQSITELSDIYIRFWKLIDGRQDREQTWKECIEVLSSNVPFAIGSLYVQKYFKASTKATAVEMFNGIKGEFVTLLKQAEWIDESTREKLLSKLKSLVPLLAMPDGGFNERSINEFYDDIKLDKNQYLRTLFQLRVIDADNKFRQTYTSTALGSSSEWKKYLPPTSIAAVYSQSDNTIRFSAGMLQNEVYEDPTINYLNYGTTGFILAHEISHIVNQILNDVDSLPPKVQSELAVKKQCLIEQYGQYRDPDASENLNGKRTLNENFADNTGIKLAYRAYKTWNEKLTGQRQNLIGLEYTWDELFWTSFAQTWCGVYRPEELTRKIISDSYATERFRVNGPLSNTPDFAKDFNCSQSSPMNRKNKCIIW